MKVRIKTSQLQNMVNEQLRILAEQEDNKKIANIIGDKTAKKMGTDKQSVVDMAKSIANANSTEQIKSIVKKQNPNADPKKLDKLSKEVIKNKSKKDHKILFRFMSAIAVLVGFAFSATIGSAWPMLLGGMFSTYFGMKGIGQDPYAKYFGSREKTGDISQDFQSTIRYNKQSFWQNFKDEMLS